MTTNLPTYNGYTNYPTWAVNLWIDNDQGLQEFYNDRALSWLGHYEGDKSAAVWDLAGEIEEQVNQDIEDMHGKDIFAGMTGDLLTWALGIVEWREIAENLLYDLEWEDPDQEDEEE